MAEKNLTGTAKPVAESKKWFIPLAWIGPKLITGQPTASEEKAEGLLRTLTSDRANAFTVVVQVPERVFDAPQPAESQ